MRSGDASLLLVVLLAGCGGSSGGSQRGAAANVLTLSVDGPLCGGSSSAYPNEPCVQVTVCEPGTGQCLTIDDILLDTGSYGLRIFRQALGPLLLQPVPAGSGRLATCVQFADLSSDWGPVQMADVVLGGEPAVRVPIHVLDATFSTPPASCPSPQTGPSAAGFNGILGVGVFAQDCGPGCTTTASNGVYFACGASGCADSAASLANQVQNPVFLLPKDNNGVIVDLPAVAAAGAPSVQGTLLLGIGTRANNALTGATAFPLDPGNGTFTTTLAGTVMDQSFLDTGSNGLFFAPPSASVLPDCGGSAAGWFCPTSTVSLTATNAGAPGTPRADLSFQIADFEALTASPNNVFADLGGGSIPGAGFDWGLPFFLGRRVAVGFDGKFSPLGTGPLVAY
jgi:hypothetical protein